MATVPTFVASLALLKQRVHMTGTVTGTDTDEMIAEAIRVSRSRFYRELGIGRVVELSGYSSADPATTADQVARQIAEGCEVRLVRLELCRTVPAAFLPTAGDAEERWNQEGLTRDIGLLHEMCEQLELLVEQDLQFLRGVDVLGEETTVGAYDIGPEDRPSRPGESVGLRLGTLPW